MIGVGQKVEPSFSSRTDCRGLNVLRRASGLQISSCSYKTVCSVMAALPKDGKIKSADLGGS